MRDERENKSTCSEKKMGYMYKRLYHQRNEFLKINSIIFLIILINGEKSIDEFLVAIIIDHASVSNVFCVDISRLNFISDNCNQ